METLTHHFNSICFHILSRNWLTTRKDHPHFHFFHKSTQCIFSLNGSQNSSKYNEWRWPLAEKIIVFSHFSKAALGQRRRWGRRQGMLNALVKMMTKSRWPHTNVWMLPWCFSTQFVFTLKIESTMTPHQSIKKWNAFATASNPCNIKRSLAIKHLSIQWHTSLTPSMVSQRWVIDQWLKCTCLSLYQYCQPPEWLRGESHLSELWVTAVTKGWIRVNCYTL